MSHLIAEVVVLAPLKVLVGEVGRGCDNDLNVKELLSSVNLILNNYLFDPEETVESLYEDIIGLCIDDIVKSRLELIAVKLLDVTGALLTVHRER